MSRNKSRSKTWAGAVAEGCSTKKLHRGGGRRVLYWESGEKGFGFFSLLGFSMVGTSLGKVLLPDSAHPRQAHSTPKGWMSLVDAHTQPLWLLLKQQVIAACTRLVAKMRNVYVNPLVGKTYSADVPMGSRCLAAGYTREHRSLGCCVCAPHIKLLDIPLIGVAELMLL